MSKETNTKIYATSKFLIVCPDEEPLPRNHFKFRKVEKKFCAKNAEPSGFLIKPKSFVNNHRGFIQNPTKLMQLNAKPLGFFTKPLGSIRNLDGSAFLSRNVFLYSTELKMVSWQWFFIWAHDKNL